MKWKNITELPSELVDEDVLFRVEMGSGNERYVVGNITNDGDLYLHGDGSLLDEYGYVCNINDIHKCGFKSIYFADPKEIEL